MTFYRRSLLNKAILLIDGDNIPSSVARHIVERASQHGELVYQGVYGCTQSLASWREACSGYSLDPSETLLSRRNATDFHIQADAWGFFEQGIKCICLATHDVGFARCIRLQEGVKYFVYMVTENVEDEERKKNNT